jgi:hypothetical protein
MKVVREKALQYFSTIPVLLSQQPFWPLHKNLTLIFGSLIFTYDSQSTKNTKVSPRENLSTYGSM